MSYDYSAPAELFLARPTKSSRTKTPSFRTAAEAGRYAVEDLPALRSLGAKLADLGMQQLQVGDERFNSDEIHRL
jgi:hypothetical protein